jgi:predicted secreted protein
MSITGGIVLFVVVWFLMMFITLPIHSRSQAEDGEIVPGTHAGAPANFRLKRTVLIVTLWAILVWSIFAAIIFSGIIAIEDLDWLGVLGERVPN